MKIADLMLTIRQRSEWEAVDLGFGLTRHCWLTIVTPVILFILFLLLNLWILLPAQWFSFSTLIIWWLKPVYDRMILYGLSHSIFARPTTIIDVFSAFPFFIKHTGLFSALTYRRFSLSRSYNLPIWQLEGMKGKSLQERKSLLYLQGHQTAIWLTATCSLLEIILILSIYGSILFFDASGVVWQYIQSIFSGTLDADQQYWQKLIDTIIYSTVILIIEPFYIAAGFILYLNRRTQLEAWDIELAFRSLGERLQTLTTNNSLSTLIIATLFTGLLLGPSLQPVYAASAAEAFAEQRLSAEQSKRIIEKVMTLEELNNRRQIKTWVPREEQQSTQPKPRAQLPPNLIALLSQAFEGLLWIGLLIALAFAFIYRKAILNALKIRKTPTLVSAPPDVLFGLDIRPESLPDDIAGSAYQLWQQGHTRAALSLLYRGALMLLTRQLQVSIADSHTEGDILRIAEPHLSSTGYQYLRALTLAWQSIAYAHRPPDESSMQHLFAGWQQFEKPAGAAV